MGRPPNKTGALTEYHVIVHGDDRDALRDAFLDLDLTDLDDIAAAHGLILAALVGGRISPEFASEVRGVLESATTLAAARAQNVFSSEAPIDGAQALAAAAANARSRRRADDAPTESPAEDGIEDV